MGCGTCDGTCDRPHVSCTMDCRAGGCGCKWGYVRDERNKCIPLESCPREKQIFDEMDDEEAGRFSVEAGYEKDGKYAKIKWEKDEMDEDEDDCSTRNFDRLVVATAEITSHAPNPACMRAVFDQICDQCEDNLQCYFKLGRKVGPH